MDIPNEIVKAVKEVTAQATEPKKRVRKPYVKDCTKRILHAVGNGLRTSDSIANALNIPRAKVQTNLWHMKEKGLVHAVKKAGTKTIRYYLTTAKPTLDGEVIDTVPKRVKAKTKRKYTKRKTKVAKVAPKQEKPSELESVLNEALARRETKQEVELKQEVVRLQQRISQLEFVVQEKEKETWVLESEIHDKKAIIRYLESKITILGGGV